MGSGRAFAYALAVTLWASTAASEGIASAPDGKTAEERGAYVLRAANCTTCHTERADDAEPLAGGRALETPFGTFYTPNITPHPETGIGDWSVEDFLRALHEGVSPGGSPYYPAFPYTSYARMSEADARDLFAYLQSLEPVEKAVSPHALRFPYNVRALLWPWRWLHFDGPAPFDPDPARSEEWNRGAYLVNALGHCAQCHTPRDFLGALQPKRHLSGNPDGPDEGTIPNITPHGDDGLADWSQRDIVFFLETGFYPDGDVAGGGMNSVIQDSTRYLSDADREAIADYLMNIPPLPND